jgi:hypothetical protein
MRDTSGAIGPPLRACAEQVSSTGAGLPAQLRIQKSRTEGPGLGELGPWDRWLKLSGISAALTDPQSRAARRKLPRPLMPQRHWPEPRHGPAVSAPRCDRAAEAPCCPPGPARAPCPAHWQNRPLPGHWGGARRWAYSARLQTITSPLKLFSPLAGTELKPLWLRTMSKRSRPLNTGMVRLQADGCRPFARPARSSRSWGP